MGSSTFPRAVGGAFAALLVLASGTTFLACVGDDPPPAVVVVDAGTASDTGLDGTASTDLCSTYCAEIAKSCTGDNRQYRDDEECMRACALLPQGTEDDGARNTVGCRLKQARAATNLDSCTVAGPFGGGTCGTRCEAFCEIVAGNCTDVPNPPYNSKSTCIEECPKLAFDPTEGEGPLIKSAGNDTINCRSHHAILALGDKATHCAHTAVVSPVCLDRDAGSDSGAADP